MAISILFDSLSLQFCLIFAAAFLMIYRFFRSEKQPNFPPGPPCLPIIGNAHKLGGGRMHIVTAELAEQFGGIMMVDFAGIKGVMLTDLRLIREAFVEKADQFSDRYQHLLTEYTTGNKGSLIFENGESWKSHRRLTLRALRNFGMGKRSFENKINEEARFLARHFEEQNGRPFDPQPTIQNAVANVICSISFGNRYDYDDTEFRRLLDFLKIFFERMSGPSLIGIFPSLWFTPFYRSLKNLNDNCISFLKRIVEQHRETFDPNDIRDIIDVHMQDNTEDHNEQKVPQSLIWRGIFDLFAGGTDTSSTSILWQILILTQYPEVQEKMQQEIDDVIGRERPPTFSDRLNMPYVDATVMEMQRFRSVAGFILPRMTSVDAEFKGYDIPKGTQVWANLWAVLHSPKHWTDPDEFIPERFLSADGKRTEKHEAFIPFGVGRRICIGEQLARMELFLFLTNLLQRFTFHIPEVDPKPDLQGSHGITWSPGAFRICAKSR